MTQTNISLPQQRKAFQTSRIDAWWSQPLIVFIGLLLFIIYSTWAGLQNEHYYYNGGGAQYISPMYSPTIWDADGEVSGHAWFGAKPDWWPAAIPLLPAFLILWAPGGFRFTCYYYRGAYYKAFWMDPANCSVGEPRKGYRGERWFPLVFQNIHRYFLYFALLFLVFLAYDAFLGYRFADETGDGKHFGIHVGSLVLTLNVILLGGYTLGCHSLRHLIGGGMDMLSGKKIRQKSYDCVSCLNRGHMRWAWASLIWVGFTDFYVRMCSMGVFTDYAIFG